MDFLCLVLGAVAAIVLYTAEQLLRKPARAPATPVSALPQRVPRRAGTPRRKIQWISAEEGAALARDSDDVIFVFLKWASAASGSVIPGISVLVVAPEELRDLLPWLPAESAVVLCGEMEVCSFVLASLEDVEGPMTIYGVAPKWEPRAQGFGLYERGA